MDDLEEPEGLVNVLWKYRLCGKLKFSVDKLDQTYILRW